MYQTLQDLGNGEATFNDVLLYPYLKAVCSSATIGKPQFKAGETELISMARKTIMTEIKDESTIYKTDGIINL